MNRLIAVVVVVIALAAAFTGYAKRGGPTGLQQERAAVSASMERRRVLTSQLVALRDAREEVLALRSGQQAIARWTALRRRGDLSGVIADTSVPAAVRDSVRARALGELARLRLTDNRRMVTFLTGDLLPADTGRRRSRTPIQVTHLLPELTGDSTCVSLVQVRQEGTATLRVMDYLSLAGVCAFVARFGPPGPRVHAWMDSVEYAFAGFARWDMRSDLARGSAPALVVSASSAGQRVTPRRQSRTDLGARGASCLMGDDVNCRILLGLAHDSAEARIPGRTAPRFNQSTGWVNATLGGAYGTRLGPAERALFSDLVIDFGADRFARFWTSSASPEAAFEAAFGESLPRYLRRWLARGYDDSPGGPRPPAVPSVLLAGVLMLSIGWSGSRSRTRTND